MKSVDFCVDIETRSVLEKEMMVHLGRVVSTEYLRLCLLFCLTACAAPPTTPLPVEDGRAGTRAAVLQTNDNAADTLKTPPAARSVVKTEDSTASPSEASSLIKRDGQAESSGSIAEDASSAARSSANGAAKISDDIVSVTDDAKIKSSLPALSLPAPISSDVLLPQDANQQTNLQSEMAALAEAKADLGGDIGADVQIDTQIDVSDLETAARDADISDADISYDTDELSSDKLLGKEALDAAFSLLASRSVQNVDTFDLVPPRVEGEFRVGVMLPLTGPYAALGADIASGAELALFQLKLPSLNLIFIDTEAGDSAVEAVQTARNADLDLIIGPLFSDSIEVLQPALSELSIPALTLTNNRDMATPNSWVLGYIPEQQIDLLLAQSIEAGDTRMAILASDDLFGQRVLQHTVTRLQDFGLKPAELMILGPDKVNDETNLREAIKQFARYQKPDDDEAVILPPAPYDSLILAGLPSFLLRVAPVLDYYDLGPDRVDYLGTDLWNRPDLLNEPSLQDSYIAIAKQPDDTAFRALWAQVFDFEPSNFAKLGFDVLAVAGALQPYIDSPSDWSKYLAREQGFSGFTGSFRLLPDGTNARQFEIKQLVEYQLQDGQITR